MTALANDRNTPRRESVDFVDPVEASQKIFAGAIVCLNAAGNAVKGATALNLKVRGVAQEYIDNSTGAAGAQQVKTRKGTFRFANDGTVTRADIDATAFIVDDQTVADNNGGNTRSAAGRIVDVDATGVWVLIA